MLGAGAIEDQTDALAAQGETAQKAELPLQDANGQHVRGEDEKRSLAEHVQAGADVVQAVWYVQDGEVLPQEDGLQRLGQAGLGGRRRPFRLERSGQQLEPRRVPPHYAFQGGRGYLRSQGEKVGQRAPGRGVEEVGERGPLEIEVDEQRIAHAGSEGCEPGGQEAGSGSAFGPLEEESTRALARAGFRSFAVAVQPQKGGPGTFGGQARELLKQHAPVAREFQSLHYRQAGRGSVRVAFPAYGEHERGAQGREKRLRLAQSPYLPGQTIGEENAVWIGSAQRFAQILDAAHRSPQAEERLFLQASGDQGEQLSILNSQQHVQPLHSHPQLYQIDNINILMKIYRKCVRVKRGAGSRAAHVRADKNMAYAREQHRYSRGGCIYSKRTTDANGADDRLKCELHSDQEAVGACAECGKAFCAIEVEKSGQSVYCPDCYNATLDELLEGYECLKKKHPVPAPEGASTAEPIPSADSETPAPARKTADPYFELGPDDDFSFFEKGGGRRRAAEPAPEPEAYEPDEVLEDVVTALMGAKGRRQSSVPSVAGKVKRGLRSRLRRAAGQQTRADAYAVPAVPQEDPEEQEARRREAEALAWQRLIRRTEARLRREERWGFLAQPRSAGETRLGSTRPRAALFIIAVTVVAALLWALPNALLVKGDTEYGLHAIAIGALVGLAFWWKAGKAHSTRLALEAAGIALGGIILGEMLHWTIIVWKEEFFRTVFDIISFKFFFTHLPSIMGKIFPEMFPLNFFWILVLPVLIAFIIGFGSPPIPEIFGQIWRALRHPHRAEPESANGS